MNKQKFWAAASVFLLLLISHAAYAQSGGSRDRLKAEKCYDTKGNPVNCDDQAKTDVAEPAAKYPNATRVEPVMPKTKIKKEWDAMVKASNEKDAASLKAAADAVLAAADASNEEKSEAYFQQYIAQITSDPTNYAAMLQIAEAAVRLGGLSNNKHYDLMRSLGLLKINDKKYAEALEYLSRFTTETGISDDLQVLKNKGNANYRLAKYPEAIATLSIAYTFDKGADPNIAIMLMDSYSKTGQKTEANRIAEEVAKTASASAAAGDSSAQVKQLLVLAKAKQYDNAAKIFEELYAKGQIANLAEYEAGYVSYSHVTGKEAQAIKIINEGMGKGVIKPDAAVYNILAESYYYTDQPKSAIEAWGKAAELSAKGEYDVLQARVYAEEDEYTKAKAAALRGLSKGVESKGDAYLLIAEAESEFGLDNRAAMIAALKEAAKDPETQIEANKRLKQAGAK